MDIVMIGISVENADLALLGSVSFTDTAKLEMLNLLGGLDIAAGPNKAARYQDGNVLYSCIINFKISY